MEQEYVNEEKVRNSKVGEWLFYVVALVLVLCVLLIIINSEINDSRNEFISDYVAKEANCNNFYMNNMTDNSYLNELYGTQNRYGNKSAATAVMIVTIFGDKTYKVTACDSTFYIKFPSMKTQPSAIY